MPIPIACPGCGLTENGPEGLLGKRLRCKRCKQAFVVGGGPAAPKPPAPKAPAAAAKAPARQSSSPSSLDFGEPDLRPPARRRARQGGGLGRFLFLLIFGFLLGAGGVGVYLYMNKPAAESASSDKESTPKTEESKFSWIVKGAGEK